MLATGLCHIGVNVVWDAYFQHHYVVVLELNIHLLVLSANYNV